MIAARTQLKIGLLVLASIAAAVIVALTLGLHTSVPSVRYHTYFDESISGLEKGSPVSYRGVRVGSVGAIAVAPDHARVDVALDITLDDAARLRIDEVAPNLRAQLQTAGITGVKYIDIEPASPNDIAAKLAFAPDRLYIPAEPSLLRSLTQHADAIGDKFPAFIDRATEVINDLDKVIVEVRDRHVVSELGGAITDLRKQIASFDKAALPDAMRRVLVRIDDAVATVRDSNAMRDVGEAARAIRQFVAEIERDPEMLVKGRARSQRP